MEMTLQSKFEEVFTRQKAFVDLDFLQDKYEKDYYLKKGVVLKRLVDMYFSNDADDTNTRGYRERITLLEETKACSDFLPVTDLVFYVMVSMLEDILEKYVQHREIDTVMANDVLFLKSIPFNTRLGVLEENVFVEVLISINRKVATTIYNYESRKNEETQNANNLSTTESKVKFSFIDNYKSFNGDTLTFRHITRKDRIYLIFKNIMELLGYRNKSVYKYASNLRELVSELPKLHSLEKSMALQINMKNYATNVNNLLEEVKTLAYINNSVLSFYELNCKLDDKIEHIYNLITKIALSELKQEVMTSTSVELDINTL